MSVDIKKLAIGIQRGDEAMIAEGLGFNADGTPLEPTPLTDAAEYDAASGFVDGKKHMMVESEFARALERKLIHAREQFLDIARDCEKMKDLVSKL